MTVKYPIWSPIQGTGNDLYEENLKGFSKWLEKEMMGNLIPLDADIHNSHHSKAYHDQIYYLVKGRLETCEKKMTDIESKIGNMELKKAKGFRAVFKKTLNSAKRELGDRNSKLVKYLKREL